MRKEMVSEVMFGKRVCRIQVKEDEAVFVIIEKMWKENVVFLKLKEEWNKNRCYIRILKCHA
jgi:hypothetical protein